MRIITLNVNGIRAAERKGLARWLARGRALGRRLPAGAQGARTTTCRSACARRASARRTSTRRSARDTRAWASTRGAPPPFATGFGSREFDREGRYLQADFRDLTVISVYLPSGSSGPHRQASKFRFLDEFLPHLASCASAGAEIVLCGDWNIAHQNIDLNNWRSNQKNSGFLPEERAWLSRVFDEFGFVDVFRKVDARPEQYTWWSNRGAGVGEERRLAHRLPDRDPRHRGQGACGVASTRTGASPITRRS